MAENNPFEDPDDNDQAPLHGAHQPPAADNAYDVEQAVEIGAVGAQQIGGQVHNAYDEGTEHQKDQNTAPPPPSFMVNLCNWFPLRFFCFIGGAGLIVCSILDFLFNKDAFIQFLLRIYLLFFGLIIMMIEAPSWACTRWFQLKIFFWFRILSRMWGRAWFYLFITILCFGEFDNENVAEFTVIAGFWLLFISLLSFIFSKLAASKYNRIYIYIASGSEGDELNAKLEGKYIELTQGSGQEKLGSFEITKLSTEAGRNLSNAERHAIQTYLDESCNGFVSKEDWMKQFQRLKDIKQRFL